MLTLQDLAKATKDKNLMAIAERLNLVNEIIQDAHWEEANGNTTHTFAFRVKLAKGAWRLFNKGVEEGSGKIEQGLAHIGMHENRVKADKDLVDIAPNPNKFFSDEVFAHAEGSAQVLAETIFYGNHDLTPASFHGLAPQLDALGKYVFSAGGSGGTLSSIYGLDWGPGKVYMVKPKGVKVPYEVTAKKEGVAYDDNGNEYDVYRCKVIMKCALVVEDPRCVFRYANINHLADIGAVGGFDTKVLNRAINGMKNRGRTAKLYCNQDVLTAIENYAEAKTNVHFTSKEIFGVDVTHFKGRPLRLCESILNTEDQVA